MKLCLFIFFLIDLGGGLRSNDHSSRIHLTDVISLPFKALWSGLATPGLRWNTPAPNANISGVFTKTLTQKGGARGLGSSNYALLSRDYLNFNTRLDFHFVMIDTVCGPRPRENYVRFRFKGGGTAAVQRARRVRFLAMVLEPEGFFVDLRGDLITASLSGAGQAVIEEKLILLGRLLGFSRLLDAAMDSDEAPRQMARAFSEGDWALKRLQ